jgi:hypothetical protein
VGFCGGDGPPVSSGGFLVVLQPRDQRRLRGEDLIEEKIGRGALTPKGGGSGWVPAWTVVRRWAARSETCTASSR